MQDKDERTFKSRLLFISYIFANKYDQDKIITSSINFKLKTSYEQYLLDLKSSTNILTSTDSIKVLKKMDK